MSMAPATAEGPPSFRPLPQRSGSRKFWDRFGWNIALVIEIIVIIGLAELAISGMGLWNPQFVPPPSDILDSFSRLAQRDLLFKDAFFSLSNFVVGYLAAVVVGVLIGLALGMLRTFRTMAGPLVWITYATPRAAIAPLIVMWLGFGAESKVAIIFLFSVYPILINVWVGARSVDQTLIRAGNIFGARHFDIYTKIVLPSIVPFLMVGLRLGLSRGLVGVVIAEFVGSSAGIGYRIGILSSQQDMAGALALTILLVVVAVVASKILDLVRRRVAPWYKEEGA
jgi:ABC-type nitrate/sulfonate/bicarbonate transport system permease component